MTVLLLRLAGPLQSWGDSSRFVRRETRPEPTKSGVLGLLAAAQGRRRTDPLEDLIRLTFGVRLDQPGRLIRDFQTARSLDERDTMPLSHRYYLGDAAFVAAVAGDTPVLEGLHDALLSPTFPLYLGRRSCPPVGPLTLGLRDGSLMDVLRSEPWHAAAWVMRRNSPVVHREVVRDRLSRDEHGEVIRDDPISFDPVRRQYGWRTVVREVVPLHNPGAVVPVDPNVPSPLDHDPFDLLGVQ